jgi:hypothetical protein
MERLDLPASLAKRYASDPLTGGVGYMNWQIQMFQNSLLEVFSNV